MGFARYLPRIPVSPAVSRRAFSSVCLAGRTPSPKGDQVSSTRGDGPGPYWEWLASRPARGRPADARGASGHRGPFSRRRPSPRRVLHRACPSGWRSSASRTKTSGRRSRDRPRRPTRTGWPVRCLVGGKAFGIERTFLGWLRSSGGLSPVAFASEDRGLCSRPSSMFAAKAATSHISVQRSWRQRSAWSSQRLPTPRCTALTVLSTTVISSPPPSSSLVTANLLVASIWLSLLPPFVLQLAPQDSSERTRTRQGLTPGSGRP